MTEEEAKDLAREYALTIVTKANNKQCYALEIAMLNYLAEDFQSAMEVKRWFLKVLAGRTK